MRRSSGLSRIELATLGLGLVLAIIAVGAGTAALLPSPEPDTVESDLPKRSVLSESHVYCVALAVYFEGGSTGETEEGQRHIARVIAERAKAGLRKWGGSDICDVVFYKKAGVCQFSFACLPEARRTPYRGPVWRRALEIAREEIEGPSETYERTIRYYMNPQLTSDRNACRFRKEFVPVGQVGRHEFFREPTSFERATLAAAEPEECKRYKAALAAAEAKRKLALKKLAEKKRLAALKKKKAAAAAKLKKIRLAAKK